MTWNKIPNPSLSTGIIIAWYKFIIRQEGCLVIYYFNKRTMCHKQLTWKKGRKKVERWGRLRKFDLKDERGCQSIIGIMPLLPHKIIVSTDHVISHGNLGLSPRTGCWSEIKLGTKHIFFFLHFFDCWEEGGCGMRDVQF